MPPHGVSQRHTLANEAHIVPRPWQSNEILSVRLGLEVRLALTDGDIEEVTDSLDDLVAVSERVNESEGVSDGVAVVDGDLLALRV